MAAENLKKMGGKKALKLIIEKKKRRFGSHMRFKSRRLL